MHLHLVTLHVKFSPQSVPLAAAFLHASIAAQQQNYPTIRVTMADYECGTPIEKIVAEISEAQAEVVGFSLYVWNRAEIVLISHHLRRLFPDLFLVGGGPEATADPDGIMEESALDLLVIGEGEATLTELLLRQIQKIPLDDLRGIVRRQGQEIVHSLPSLPLSIETLPSPWLTGLLDAYIPSGVLWQLARGCSFGCDFCFDGMGTRTVRRFPLSRVAAELDYLVQHGVHQVFVLDSTFNQDLKRAKKILKMIRERAPRVHFHFEIRYEFLDIESVQLFSEISCSLQIGLQSTSSKILGEVGRTFNSKEFIRKVELLNNSGVTFGFDLIYGLPGDSLQEFRQSLDFALKQYPNQLDIFPLAILPGTALAGKSELLQLLHLSSPPYTILSSTTFPTTDLAIAQRLATACDIFYSRGKAVAWFNSIAAALKLSPSALLLAFADWMLSTFGNDPTPIDHDDMAIWSLQRRFLSDVFNGQNVDKLLPMALDLIDYHYSHAAVLQIPPPLPPRARDLKKLDVLNTPLRKSASSCLVNFSYNIEELINLGEPQIAAAAFQLKPTGSCAVLYSRHGEVCSEVLPEEYYQLLEKLDGLKLAVTIAQTLGISSESADKFLRIALHEGIIVVAEE